MSWVVTAPPIPARHGPGWTDSPQIPTPATGQGWLSTPYTLTPPLAGAGTLTGTVVPSLKVLFSGAGSLTEVLVSEVQDINLQLSGTGTLSAIVPRTSMDGLSGWAYEVYGPVAQFSGQGTLVASLVKQIYAAAPGLSGAGTFAGDPHQIYSQLAAMSGDGTLSGQAFELYKALVALTGSGTLTASVIQNFLVSVGLSSAGTLAAQLFAMYAAAGPQTGSGTLGMLVMQKYTVSPALSGDGNLAVTAAPAFTPPLAGAGALSATATIASVVFPYLTPFPLISPKYPYKLRSAPSQLPHTLPITLGF